MIWIKYDDLVYVKFHGRFLIVIHRTNVKDTISRFLRKTDERWGNNKGVMCDAMVLPHVSFTRAWIKTKRTAY